MGTKEKISVVEYYEILAELLGLHIDRFWDEKQLREELDLLYKLADSSNIPHHKLTEEELKTIL